MAISRDTYQPLQLLTIRATADLPQFRFVNLSGSLCADGTRAYGVTETSWLTGEHASVVSLGTVPMETSAQVNAGDDLTASDNGKARKALAGEIVNGRALASTPSAGIVKIKLVP